VLNDFPVFDEQKDFSTIIIKSSESHENEEEDEEEKEKELSPL
jgi:hypothetical protein